MTVKKVLVLCLIAALCVEAAAFVGVYFLQKRLVFYNAPSPSTYSVYMENRDPVLGWPSKTILKEKYDTSGSRPIPSFPEPKNACISLYGDSFTWSDSATDGEAWSNQLSILQGCRVSNYGVSGYGTDQSFLRFEQNTGDHAPNVILNHFTGDIRRNVIQFRNLTSDDEYFMFKPRFLLKGDNLELVPIISPTFEEAKKIASHPEEYLPYEYFVPGGKAGIVKAQFPYTFSLLKAFGNEHLQARFKGIPVWEAYYHEEHPSGAFQLTIAILKKFVSVAKERGKRGIVTIIPNAHDVHYFEEEGRWAHSPMLETLRNSGIEVFDFGPGIIEKLKDKDICDVMEENLCYGHFNAAGYRILAELMHEYLKIQLN